MRKLPWWCYRLEFKVKSQASCIVTNTRVMLFGFWSVYSMVHHASDSERTAQYIRDIRFMHRNGTLIPEYAK